MEPSLQKALQLDSTEIRYFSTEDKPIETGINSKVFVDCLCPFLYGLLSYYIPTSSPRLDIPTFANLVIKNRVYTEKSTPFSKLIEICQ